MILQVDFLRSVSGQDGADESVPSSTRVQLDQSFPGRVVLADVAAGPVTVSVLGISGAALWNRTFSATGGVVEIELDAAALREREAHAQELPPDTIAGRVVRAARLVATGGVPLDFSRAGVSVAPVADLTALDAVGLAALEHAAGTRVASLEVTGQDLAAVRALALLPARVGVDGVIVAVFIQAPSLGWLWWLTGDHQVVGFIPDDLSVADRPRIVVPLPALSVAPVPVDGTPPPRSVPADVSEDELADNPDVFTEDPGSYCTPFSNPERIVGERAFSVIARVDQPEISATPTRRTKLLSILSAPVPAEPSGGGVTRLRRRVMTAGTRLSGAAFGVINETMLPQRRRFPQRYLDLVESLPSGRTTLDAQHPLQWEDDIAQYQAATIALGHILEYRVRWRSNGYSLGTVASTLTLAPRQTKRIQKIEWERRERALRRESTQLRDEENDAVIRERDYTDTVSASLSEWARGSSSSRASSVAGGIGFFGPGILGGVGGGASSAYSTSQQSGGRDTTASEQQRLRDAIRRHGDSLRRLESTVVTEVGQEETVTGTTEVIRNANFEHSLTVIYYQILRHLRVTTEFAGVRECLFVPFAIKPFDVFRAYRWRESLERSMRSPRFSRALRYLKDVATSFATSDVAPGARAAQPLTFVRGSVYVQLGVERPRDTSDGGFDPGPWSILQPLLQTPAQGIFSVLHALADSSRDRAFQAEHAPAIAARWADRLQLRLGNRVLRADFTLASRYQFNSGVRIDFSLPSSELAGLSRESLQQLVVASPAALPRGSVANLTRVSLTYSTDRFEHTVEGRSGTNDLVTPASGAPDAAAVTVPLDAWERVNERLEITRSVQELVEHLNEHIEYYTKAVLWGMDHDRLLMMLDGFYVPGTNNVSVASIVDREPVGIIGNCLVYRVGAASFIGNGKVKTRADLHNVYAESEPVSDPLFVSLPTDGLYAQAVMDECGALEEHYGNTDWVLADEEPDLGTLDPSQLLTRRADPSAGTAPTPFPATIINLMNAPDAPAPQGLAGALGAVTNANAFRDMAGLGGTQANALAALNTAAGLATNFGNQAAALELAKLAKAQEATKTADQKLASISKSVDKGLTSPEQAADAAKSVLDAMNPDSPRAAAPHENGAIQAAIDASKSVPGSTVEATTGEGAVKVALGGERTASVQGGLTRICGFFGPDGAHVDEDELREAIRDLAVAEHANWWDAAGAVVEEGADSQFGHLVAYWLSSKARIRPTTLVALTANAGSMTDAEFGDLLTPGATAAQVTAAVASARARLLQNAPDADFPADLATLVEQSLRSARRSRRDELPGGPWSAVFVSDCVRSAVIQLGLEGLLSGPSATGLTAAGRHVGRDEYLTVSSAHRIYVLAAYRARFGPNRMQGTYHVFQTDEIVPRIGDIIVQDRRDGIRIGDVLAFGDIPAQLVSDFALHGDIVVEVPAGQDYVVTVGGNVGQSSRIRRYPLDANRHLVVERTQLFVAEDDAGSIPALPRTSNAPGLNDHSTGRIFAVLSPVPVCAVVPGQRFGEGVIA